MIDYVHIGVRHAKALLAAVTDCGAEPPKALTDLVTAFDSLAAVQATSDPMNDLVSAVAAGNVDGPKLDKLLAEAAMAKQILELRVSLKQRVELPLMKQFGARLNDGAADEIIASLAPQFDKAAAGLAKCAEVVPATVDAEDYLRSVDDAGRKAWQAIDGHVAVLTRIGSAVSQFGPLSTTFPLIEKPTNFPFLADNRALMCVSPEMDLMLSCQAFTSINGPHRHSPWFKLASVLKLNTIAEARERVRATAESAWDAVGMGQGRGILDPDKGFIPTSYANPHKLPEPAEAKG